MKDMLLRFRAICVERKSRLDLEKRGTRSTILFKTSHAFVLCTKKRIENEALCRFYI